MSIDIQLGTVVLRDAVPSLSSNAAGRLQPTSETAEAEQQAEGKEPDAKSEAKQAFPPKTVRELEAALQTLGFSRRQAKVIASSGFKALGTSPEESDDTETTAELVAALMRRGEAFDIRVTHHGTVPNQAPD